VSPPKGIYEIYDEPTCGGPPRLLATDVRSLAFGFDEQNRLVHFVAVNGGELLLPQLVVRTAAGGHEPFLGGCIVSNDQKLFVDVSEDGKRELVSRELSDGLETIQYIGAGGDACGQVFASSGAGPFGSSSVRYFIAATRLSGDAGAAVSQGGRGGSGTIHQSCKITVQTPFARIVSVC